MFGKQMNEKATESVRRKPIYSNLDLRLEGHLRLGTASLQESHPESLSLSTHLIGVPQPSLHIMWTVGRVNILVAPKSGGCLSHYGISFPLKSP